MTKGARILARLARVESSSPRILGAYALLSALGQGGMGSVYLATRVDQAAPRSLLLVKTLKAGLADAKDYAARFADEMRVAVCLRHPNLCAVFEGGNEAGEFFLAMELIEGITFKRLLALLNVRGERLSTTQAVALTVAVLRGLHGAHGARDGSGRLLGVVHRDVSPHNAMIDVHGRVKVIDFGLATSVLKETFTESAVVLGKSAYMSPEQARGEDATIAADQYAAGIVLYELLTQERFYGDLSSRQIWSVAGAGNHQPRRWDDVPLHLRAALARALSFDPKKRFAGCAAFADALVDAEPRAVEAEVLRGVGERVRALEPDELGTIAAARAQLQQFEGATGRSLVAPRPVAVAPGASTGGATGARTVDDTSATALAQRTAAHEVAATRRLVKLVAAVAGVACLAAVAAVVVVVVARPQPAPAPIVVVQAPPPPPPVVTTPPPVVAPTPPQPFVDDDFRRRVDALQLRWHEKQGLAGCKRLKPSVTALLAIPADVVPTPKQRDALDAAERTLARCQ